MVLTRLPLMAIGSDRAPACWACADCKSPQLQKTMPLATAVVALRKVRQIAVICISSRVRFLAYAARAASLFESPAMRLCHITRGWVMFHGVAWCSRQRLSQTTASPGVQSW